MDFKNKRVLIADDEERFVTLLKRVLTQIGWQADCAVNGQEALDMAKRTPYQVLLTDLNMPVMNGMQLVSRICWEMNDVPLMILFTAYADREIQERARKHGVYAVLKKPADFKELSILFFQGLRDIQEKRFFPKTGTTPPPIQAEDFSDSEDPLPPPFPAVVLASSTGGPPALKRLLGPWVQKLGAPIIGVQHGPGWALRGLVQSLARNVPENGVFSLAAQGQDPQPNRVYLAPGGLHLRIEQDTGRFHLYEGPPVNFLCPAADPLFSSAAQFFGKHTLGVILTGLGRDGADGATLIRNKGGRILVQDPQTATAPYMPQAVLKQVPDAHMAPLEQLPDLIAQEVQKMTKSLNLASRGAL